MCHRYIQSSVRPAAQGQSGVTLIELMISMAIGLFIVMAATALLISTKSSYLIVDDDAQIQATGRYAIEMVSRAIRQASYVSRDATDGAVSASFAGLDARSLKSSSSGIESPVAKSINGSDVLAVRFQGSGTGSNGDGTMANCAGFGVGIAPTQPMESEGRGWSIFYVAEDATGEPELYCKYQGNTGWSSQAIARGVESFQVLYGLDTDGDGLPNRFVNATAINALDDALVLVGASAAERAVDRNRKTHWKLVTGVKLAFLVRGANAIQRESSAAYYDLFGKDYANVFSSADSGTRISVAKLPKAVQDRGRQIFATTVYLRNRRGQSVGGAA